MIRSIRIANDVFFTCEKNDTSNQKPQRCVSFAPKFPLFIAACSAASHTFNEKSFTQRVFLARKVKNISEMAWNSFVCFTIDKENSREPAKQQRKGKNRTRRKLLLCFLSVLLCLSFKLKLILKPVSVKRRLRTADCRLRTRGKMQTECKMQTAD